MLYEFKAQKNEKMIISTKLFPTVTLLPEDETGAGEWEGMGKTLKNA